MVLFFSSNIYTLVLRSDKLACRIRPHQRLPAKSTSSQFIRIIHVLLVFACVRANSTNSFSLAITINGVGLSPTVPNYSASVNGFLILRFGADVPIRWLVELLNEVQQIVHRARPAARFHADEIIQAVRACGGLDG